MGVIQPLIPGMPMGAPGSQLASGGNADRDGGTAHDFSSMDFSSPRLDALPAKPGTRPTIQYLITDLWHWVSSHVSTDLSSLKQIHILDIRFLYCISCFFQSSLSWTYKRAFFFSICYRIPYSISKEIKVNRKLLQPVTKDKLIKNSDSLGMNLSALSSVQLLSALTR